MAFWTIIAIIGFTVLGELLAPRPKTNVPKASGLGDFDVPTVDSTRAIPVVFGTVLCKGPNVLWYGDLVVTPIRQSIRTSIFTSSTITVGYYYKLGMQLGLCQGLVDQFRSLRFGANGEKVADLYSPTVMGDHTRYSLTAPGGVFAQLFSRNRTLLGGDAGGGGVGGSFDFYPGGGTQAPNDYLQAVIGSALPGYNTLSYIVLRQCYLGTSPYLPNISAEVSRFPNTLGLTSGHHIIASDDCNPACALYEILTNPVWGLGKSTGVIDLAGFQAAGDALYAEGFGLSINFDQVTEARDMIGEILRHIDAVIYTDPTSGLITIRLVRHDYSVGALPVLDDSCVRDVEFSRPSWSELQNAVRVAYVSRAGGYVPGFAEQQNLAAMNVQGERIPDQVEFNGISRAAVANLVAARELKAVSYPFATLRIFVNRTAWALAPGQPFVLNWPPLGISGLVGRVIRPDYGTLEEGEITLEAIEDAFAVAGTAFSGPPVSGWVDPVGPPVAITTARFFEAPYHLAGSAIYVGLVAALRSAGGELGYQVWSDRTGGTNYAVANPSALFAPSGLLVGPYVKSTAAIDTTGFVIDTGTDLAELLSCTDDEFTGGVNLLMVDDEIMGFRDVTDHGDGTFTIAHVMRGVFDTVPADHADNARVYFLRPDGAAPLDAAAPYPALTTVKSKLLPFSGRGLLDIASASPTDLTLVGRVDLPYPPGNVKIGGTAWPSTISHTGNTPVSWSTRNKFDQLAGLVIVAQDATDFSTAEGPFTIDIFVAGSGTAIRTVTGLTTSPWTWTGVMKAADGATAGVAVRIRVTPNNAVPVAGPYQQRDFVMS